MKPPVKLDELMEEWHNDCKLDSTEPGLELIRISSLHGKYLHILSHHRMLVKKITNEYNKLRLTKFQYYHGELDMEELKERGWEPNSRIIIKQNIPIYMDADEDLNNIVLKKVIHEEVVEFCTSVVKELNSRVYALRSFIEWKKMTDR